MSLIVVLYAVILVVAAAALVGAYRVLGTPSRLTPVDYANVLDDVVRSVTRAAERLRGALDNPAGPQLTDIAAESRKIFQTAYYQTLRLRPDSGPDITASTREVLGRACEVYDWASRMIGGASVRNPLILEAACSLLDAGDEQLRRAAQALSATTRVSGSSEP